MSKGFGHHSLTHFFLTALGFSAFCKHCHFLSGWWGLTFHVRVSLRGGGSTGKVAFSPGWESLKWQFHSAEKIHLIFRKRLKSGTVLSKNTLKMRYWMKAVGFTFSFSFFFFLFQSRNSSVPKFLIWKIKVLHWGVNADLWGGKIRHLHPHHSVMASWSFCWAGAPAPQVGCLKLSCLEMCSSSYLFTAQGILHPPHRFLLWGSDFWELQ